MINLVQARARIAELITTQLGDRVTVYPAALDATANLPCVALGVPDFTPDAQPCVDLITIPVAVVVPLLSGAAMANQDQLEALWSELVEGLREDIRTQPGLGIARNAVIRRAQYGGFAIQGQEYPAMVTYLDLFG